MPYRIPIAALGYDAGTPLRDVTLAEAQSWECNRCGDCCDSSREDVRKDVATGLPLLVWESRERAADPARSRTYDPDRYADRFNGKRLIQPIVMTDGGIGVGKTFDRDVDGMPHTSFKCAALIENPDGEGGPESGCALRATAEQDERRPEQCGSFPVFGTIVSDAIVGSGYYVPPTGALPRCTWYGIRVTGPLNNAPGWVDRFERQSRGEPVEVVPAIPAGVAAALLRRAGRNV